MINHLHRGYIPKENKIYKKIPKGTEEYEMRTRNQTSNLVLQVHEPPRRKWSFTKHKFLTKYNILDNKYIIKSNKPLDLKSSP